MSGKTATERLREMLDERGVAHSDHYLSTTWRDGHGILHLAGEQMADGSLVVDMLTPEQAIAATLGSEFNHDGLPVGFTISDDSNLLNWRGENYVRQSALSGGKLTVEQVRECVQHVYYEGYNDSSVYRGHGIEEVDWQTIADELNSRAERTCKQEERGWGTEGDHARVWLTCGHDCMVPTVQDLPNYCPSCGCKVVGE